MVSAGQGRHVHDTLDKGKNLDKISAQCLISHTSAWPTEMPGSAL
jgi:hypothetical protein